MPKHPGEESRRVDELVGQQALRRAGHVAAEDETAMQVAHHVHGEVVEHGTVDQNTSVVDNRRQNAGQGDGCAQGVAHLSKAVHEESTVREIG